jgi:hypothetical protein
MGKEELRDPARGAWDLILIGGSTPHRIPFHDCLLLDFPLFMEDHAGVMQNKQTMIVIEENCILVLLIKL